MDARLGFGTRLRWFCDHFVTVEFVENEHYAVALGSGSDVIRMSMSDVNSDSSDTDSASAAMSPTATLL